MGQEIERKFLVVSDEWRTTDPTGRSFRQGYLCVERERTVRVRTVGDQGFLTIKGKSTGAVRAEFEYSIDGGEARTMLDTLCLKPLIEKTRYRLPAGGGLWWEVDVFAGDNAGLVVAEIELPEVTQVFARPAWIGTEVTEDPRYFNSNLVLKPYKSWA